MSIGIVLLSQDGYYVGANGKLPARPDWDKSLIISLAKDQTVLCSENTKATLPASICNSCRKVTTNTKDYWDINFGISTFRAAPPDIFIVTRSLAKLYDGKKFDYDWLATNYINHHTTEEVELWIINS